MKESHKKIAGQFTRYFAVAGIGYIFDFCTLLLLREFFGVNYLIAAASGFIVGLIVLYILSNLFVFKDSKIQSKSLEFGIFALIGIIGLGILSVSMWVFTGLLGLNYLLSKIVGTIFVYAWNFFARRAMYHG